MLRVLLPTGWWKHTRCLGRLVLGRSAAFFNCCLCATTSPWLVFFGLLCSFLHRSSLVGKWYPLQVLGKIAYKELHHRHCKHLFLAFFFPFLFLCLFFFLSWSFFFSCSSADHSECTCPFHSSPRFRSRSIFDIDNIDLGPERRQYLDHTMERIWEFNSQGSIPYVPYLRAPFYVWVGRPVVKQSSRKRGRAGRRRAGGLVPTVFVCGANRDARSAL